MIVAQTEIISAKWLSNLAFEGDIDGHKILMDGDPAVGGDGLGPSPKPFMLLALGGCTGLDVISILKKMRVDVDSFNVKVEGELTDDLPRHYHKMHVTYEFTGKDLPLDKLEKAIELSEKKYCGVSAVYRKALEITKEIKIKET